MNYNQVFRPKSIEKMIGSTSVRTTLSTLVKKDKVPNILIFHGDNGIGKTTLAYALTHDIMCGCNEEVCDVRNQLWHRHDLSLQTNIYEVDLGKDRDEAFIDNIVDLFRIKGKKVIILDEIQNISKINMTKFLKTMDNIDKDTYLIICTTELYRLDNGIVSRSEVFTLNPPSVVELATHLETICRYLNVRFSRNAIMLIAKNKYRVRDALRTLETIVDTYGNVEIEGVREYFGKVGIENQMKFLNACRKDSPYDLLFLLNDIQQQEGMYNFTEGFKEFLLNGVYIQNGIKPPQYLEEEISDIYHTLKHFSLDELSEIIYRIENMPQKTNIDRQIAFVCLGLDINKGNLLNKINKVENKKAEIKQFEPKLGNDLIIENTNSSFTLESESSLPDLENKKEVKNKKINLGMDSESIKSLFEGDNNR